MSAAAGLVCPLKVVLVIFHAVTAVAQLFENCVQWSEVIEAFVFDGDAIMRLVVECGTLNLKRVHYRLLEICHI